MGRGSGCRRRGSGGCSACGPGEQAESLRTARELPLPRCCGHSEEGLSLSRSFLPGTWTSCPGSGLLPLPVTLSHPPDGFSRELVLRHDFRRKMSESYVLSEEEVAGRDACSVLSATPPPCTAGRSVRSCPEQRRQRHEGWLSTKTHSLEYLVLTG